MMDVKLPNGEILYDVPDGLSREEIIRRYVKKKEPQEETTQEPQAKKGEPSVSFVEGLPPELFKSSHPTAQIAIGAAKPFAAAAQYAGFNAPANTLNALSKRFEEEGNSPTISSGLDLTGQMVSPLQTKGVNAVQNLATKVAPNVMKSNLVRGGVQGFVSGMLNPVDTKKGDNYGNFLENKAENVGASTLVGGGLNKLAQGLMNPKVSEAIKKARAMGMQLTPGQLLGFPNLEKKLTSLPISGRFVQGSLDDTNQMMNRAVANDALKSVNSKLPEDIPAGSEMMENLAKKVNESYKEIAKKIDFVPDKNTINYLNAVATRAAQGISRDREREIFYETLKKNFFEPLMQNYKLTGKAFRNAESNLGTIANKYKNQTDQFEKDVGFALFDFQAALRKELARLNPAHAKELTGIHEFFRKYLVMQKAAGSAGAVNNANVFTPAQLSTAARLMADKMKKATSKGLLMKEANEYQNMLGKTVPDSGTATRSAVTKGLGAAGELLAGGAGAITNHSLVGAVAPMAGMYALYNPATKALLNTAIAGARPKVLQQAEPAVSSGLANAAGKVDYSSQ
jgi:hypothetical protein